MRKVYFLLIAVLNGVDKNLLDYKGKLILIVNTASACGFTPQYKELEELFKRI